MQLIVRMLRKVTTVSAISEKWIHFLRWLWNNACDSGDVRSPTKYFTLHLHLHLHPYKHLKLSASISSLCFVFRYLKQLHCFPLRLFWRRVSVIIFYINHTFLLYSVIIKADCLYIRFCMTLFCSAFLQNNSPHVHKHVSLYIATETFFLLTLNDYYYIAY